jgi:hypothetical protein
MGDGGAECGRDRNFGYQAWRIVVVVRRAGPIDGQ